MSPTPTTGATPSSDELRKALQDGLVGRRALMRMYEGVSERAADSSLKSRLREFAAEEKVEYDRAVEITRRHGGDPGLVQNVKEEVTAFLGKTLMKGGAEPYSSARDVAMLHGLESSGHTGAIFLRHVAQRANDNDWVGAIDESIERAERHMEFLQQQAEQLGRMAFQP